MARRRRRRRHGRGEWTYRDFSCVLALPERLSELMREALHLEKADWDFCLDKIRQGVAYREWSVEKGRGKGRRYFAAPCPELKRVQRAILNQFLSQVAVHFSRHGNQKGSSIMSNVRRHAGFAKEVFSVDIVNAFPSVFRSRIRANLRAPFRAMMRQFKGVSFGEATIAVREQIPKTENVVALLRTYDLDFMLESLVDLVCYHDRLPQGPPTSPRILGVVCKGLDEKLYELCHGSSTPFQSYRITAWADDITISSDGEIPEELRDRILKTIHAHGFVPHTRKDKTVHYSPQTGRLPVVTGLVLAQDGRITIVPGKINLLRARLHQLLQKEEWDVSDCGKVAGELGYLLQVYQDVKLPSRIAKLAASARAKLDQEKLKRLQAGLSRQEQPATPEPRMRRRSSRSVSQPRRKEEPPPISETVPF